MSEASRWILIAEDDPVLLQMLSDYIRGPGFRVSTAADALHAFLQARDLKPALIISDMQMPGFYGSATLAELRKDPELSRTPIIFVTGMNPEKAERLLPANDSHVHLMTKPVDWPRLTAMVTELTGLTLEHDE